MLYNDEDRPERVLAPEEEHDRPRRSDGSGYATLSLILGLIGIPSVACCGVGAVFGLGGVLAGYAGLQSKNRALAIFGIVLSTAAVVFGIGLAAVFIVTQSAVDREVPPAPDGTQAPFVVPKK